MVDMFCPWLYFIWTSLMVKKLLNYIEEMKWKHIIYTAYCSISSKKCVFDDCSTYSVTLLSTLFNFKTFTPVEESAHHRRKWENAIWNLKRGSRTWQREEIPPVHPKNSGGHKGKWNMHEVIIRMPGKRPFFIFLISHDD